MIMSTQIKGFVATFSREKETKNTVRFQEDAKDGQPPRVGTLYVQKWAAGAAKNLKVTVEATG